MRYILTGVETRNKGAELMLYAILQQIEHRDPNAEVYIRMAAVPQGLNYVKTKVILREKPYKKFVQIADFLHIPGILRRLHLPYVPFFSDARPVDNIDYLIDGSGFWFTDQWNLSDYDVELWQSMLREYHKQGTRIVFLPQAFGPINLQNTKSIIASINAYADLIMPREKVSYDYLVQEGVRKDKLCLYPDFTALVDGIFPQGYEHLRNGVCVIPNMRMIDKGAISFSNYLCILSTIINLARNEGHVVYLLNHESSQDEQLSLMCQRELEGKIEVVTRLNALEVKGLISSSYLCLSSRFHGVASALNSCVPCLATSWSHKYAELLKDYGQHDCILDLNDIQSIEYTVKEYLNSHKNLLIRKQIQDHVLHIKSLNKEMWGKVFI